MWDELAVGALGAVVLADTRRVADCFASIDYFERNGTPFVIAVNCFDGAPRFEPEDIRIALTLEPEVPDRAVRRPAAGLGQAGARQPGQVRHEQQQPAEPGHASLSRGYTRATAAMTWPSRLLSSVASSQPGRHRRASTAPGGTSSSWPKKAAKSAVEWL